MAARGGARLGAGRKPGKVSQAKRDIAEAAKDYAEAALKTLVEIHSSATASDSARVTAANAIIDRAYGKARQAIEVDGAFKGSFTVQYVTGPTGPAPAPSDEDYETGE